MYLKKVLKGIDVKTKDEISGLGIHGISCDSRKTRKGDLFIAVKGCALDGHRFIGEAISNGAVAVLSDRSFSSSNAVKKILVKDAQTSLPALAANFYGNPSKRLKVIGVTGTNGKTTVTYLLESILNKAGFETGVIGTINYRFKEKAFTATNTTPGPIELESMLADMLKSGCEYAIMEVSSHSLHQHRVDNIFFDTAVFTNITEEHLDYHRTIGNYFEAKKRIFGKLKSRGTAILNNDDKRVAALKNSIKKRVLTYGLENDADVAAKEIKLSLNGSSFIAVTPKGPIDIRTKLIGRHNVSNILAGIAASFADGLDLGHIKRGVESFECVPGRLEPIDLRQPFRVFVDYAHTEDALYNILSLLRAVAKNNIITVVGCGGNRDRKKRPLMGKVSCEYSDRVIITSDNPRFEEPRHIISEIENGIIGRYSNYEVIEDRRAAIEKALACASRDDIVVIAGKGHEKYQIVKDKIMPFDDCEVVRSILKGNKNESIRTIKDNKREVAVRRS